MTSLLVQPLLSFKLVNGQSQLLAVQIRSNFQYLTILTAYLYMEQLQSKLVQLLALVFSILLLLLQSPPILFQTHSQ